jgi:5-hydroxyisourate hydrolase
MTVSTHVLDASRGVPAAGIPLTLARSAGLPETAGPGQWLTLASGVTDADGRHRFAVPTPPGAYRLTFTTGTYFAVHAVAAFYPEVTITFMVTKPAEALANGKEAHFHVPLLLSPFAYSTYRGS